MSRATLALTLTVALAPAGALANVVPQTNGSAFSAKSYSTYTASSTHAPKVRNQVPAPGSHLRTFYPQFSATVDTNGAPLDRLAVHLFVDGQDVTDATSVTQNTVSYLPRARVSTGWHDVFLEGADTAGQTFSDAWVFQSAAPDTNVDPPDTAGFSFYPVGANDFGTWNHGRGNFMHFFFQSPFFGTPILQLCGAPVTGTFIQVPFAPVFFATVAFPASSVGGALTPFLGCGTAGVLFTPNQLNFGTVFVPVVPIGIAGPAVTPNIPSQWSTRSMQPGLRSAQFPATPSMSVPVVPSASVGTYRSTMPVYRVVPNTVAPMPVPNAMPMMRSVMPVMRVPMPAARPVAPPPPVARPIPH